MISSIQFDEMCVRESRWKLELVVLHNIKMGMRYAIASKFHINMRESC